MSLSDWAVCPDISCDSAKENVTVDTVDHGDGHVFISFRCEDCEYGSLEDDFRWWVRCPECMSDGDTPVDTIEYNVKYDGSVHFKCEDCGRSIEEFPTSRWDS